MLSDIEASSDAFKIIVLELVYSKIIFRVTFNFVDVTMARGRRGAYHLRESILDQDYYYTSIGKLYENTR